MPGETIDLRRERKELLPARGVKLFAEHGAQACGSRQIGCCVRVDTIAYSIQRILWKIHHLAHVTDRLPGAEGGVSAGHCDVIVAVFLIDVLNRLLASVSRKIQID